MAVKEALQHRPDGRMAIPGALPLQAIKHTPVEQQRLLRNGNAWHQDSCLNHFVQGATL